MAFKNGVKVEVTIDINNIENKVTESDKKLIDNKELYNKLNHGDLNVLENYSRSNIILKIDELINRN